jgi:DNA-binding transcriptional LysR family regulator
MFSYHIAKELHDGLLRILLAGDEPAPIPVHLVAPHGRLQVPKVRAFADFAVPRLKAHYARLGIESDRANIQPSSGRESSK